MSRKTKKLLVVAMVSASALVAGLLWWKSGATAAVESRPQIVKARKGSLQVKVSSTGTVEPAFTVEIKSKASGTVENVPVQEGDTVKKGAMLVQIDPIVEKRKVLQAEADVRIAESRRRSAVHKRDFALAEVKRDEALLKKGLVSRDSVQALRKEAAVLKGEVVAASAQLLREREMLREARDRLAETKITAPIAGTVLERAVQPGQIVASGTNSASGGTALLKIADLSKLFVKVKVDEADIARVKAGQPVEVTADALPGKRFGGKVERVSPQGRVESNVTVFDVVVALDKEGRENVRPMMTANVEIVVAEKNDVVVLPVRAVRRQAKGNGRTVVVPKQGERSVTVGLSDGKSVEIVSGVAAGDEVALPVLGSAKGKARTNGQRRQGSNGMSGMRAMGGGRR